MAITQSGIHIGAARNWVNWNIPNGDRLQYSSQDSFNITMEQLDELAQAVANTMQTEIDVLKLKLKAANGLTLSADEKHLLEQL